ncbi:glycoside hydrolase family 2 protein [Streptomyces iranensis]|uniref:Exo-1,4-beta-D-glucosaminidase n=1 Tax=Streptomyces iranensis TaxID=576784 RepID=A0A060ZMN1_9ACTN|nr:exo-beta-D-glucosaminidase [Streptomyces iranensis]MBP2061894.1 exo-1,4-beta-D-glucosaminidase [Streptomyces iranensis]CDR03661.1 glycoside hydrolase family 2 sugar-bindingprotein [Streptomyces iranensis]
MVLRPAPFRRRARARVRRALTASLAVGGLLLTVSLTTGAAPPRGGPAAGGPTPVTRVGAAPGTATPLAGFATQSSAKVSDTPAAISTPGYPASGWHSVGPRSTVLAGLLAAGAYPDPFYSTNLEKIPAADFTVPWWYRGDFTVADPSRRTYLDVSGVVSAADVYVNGVQVATKDRIAGAYTQHELDVTELVRAGANTVAFRVQPNDPRKNLTMGWIDWLQPPPDENMGIVRDVLVRRGGPVALRDAHVTTRLDTESLASAELTVKARVRNDSASSVTATVSGTAGPAAISRTVSLAPHETKAVAFTPADFPQLRLDRPKVWWPAGMGGQPLYDLDLTATVSGTSSDTAHHSFGIRDVKAPLNADGARQYRINGRPLLIKAGGWSPDVFLRWDARSVEDRLKYTLDLGLNTVRLEGHIEPDEFFDLADRYGVLTLPGWECCDKWEGQVNGDETGEKWTPADYPVAKDSMAAEAARLRDHPSVISFLIGSDFAPDATIEKNYLDALKAADWPNPVIPAASAKSSPQLGKSGMKMTGPYDWVPPDYWYAKREGGATGFNSETSAGPDIPTLDTLRRMMSPSELETLWRDPSAKQYHRSPSATFGDLKLFDNALIGRYGKPTGLTDYVRKAGLARYEAVRAQFEAYARNFSDTSRPATGVVHWMLNSGWTSLHWQLFDRFSDQGGAYYGAKKANEPLHIQYSYDSRSVVVVNSEHTAATGLTARVSLYTPDGTRKFDQSATGLRVPGDGGKATALTVPADVSGLSGAYLVKLQLTDGAGKEVSRNVYWLSTEKDVLDWDNTDWYYTPTTSYADLTGLDDMAEAPVSATATTTGGPDSTATTTVTLRNTGSGRTPALLVDAHLVNGSGKPVLPVRWSDNEVSLWPGESVTLTATYRTADLGGSAPSVRISGWNTATRTVPATAKTR